MERKIKIHNHTSSYPPLDGIKKIKTVDDLHKFQVRMVNHLMKREISIKAAATISSYCKGILRTLEVGKLEKDIEEIKRTLAVNNRRGF